jgi:L-ribulokinase
MPAASRFSVGIDFGTESVRVLVVDVRSGRVAGQGSRDYAHGVIDRQLPTSGEKLPPDYALQHPQDWLDGSSAACRAALREADVSPDQVVGVGVAFTSCTMLPALADGTPLCLLERFKNAPLAWPRLSNHRGARAEADRINEVARGREEKWLARYGGIIGVEWFFPKVLETLDHEPVVYDAAEVWLEAGDWFVWQLVDGPYPRCKPDHLTRSTCQAGFRACWNKHTGFPSEDFLQAVHPKLRDVVTRKMPGHFDSPGRKSGELSQTGAELLGLKPGTAVSTAIIGAHANIPGAGVAAPSTMVIVAGVIVTGAGPRLLMNSRIEAVTPRIRGVVEDGILPGYVGYEMEPPSVEDALAEFGEMSDLPPDTLRHIATACEVRRACDDLRGAGVPVRRFVATGERSRISPALMQVYADVLGDKVRPAASDQPAALGAAILGALAAGHELTGHASMSQAIHAMAPEREDDLVYRPDIRARKQYAKVYELYRQLGTGDGATATVMRALREL